MIRTVAWSVLLFDFAKTQEDVPKVMKWLEEHPLFICGFLVDKKYKCCYNF